MQTKNITTNKKNANKENIRETFSNALNAFIPLSDIEIDTN